MGYQQWYVAEETAGEYKSGRISYAELLRRLTLLTGSSVAALALAVTLGYSAATAPTNTNPVTPTAVVAHCGPLSNGPAPRHRHRRRCCRHRRQGHLEER